MAMEDANEISFARLQEAQKIIDVLDSQYYSGSPVGVVVVMLKTLTKIEMLRRARDPRVASSIAQAADMLSPLLDLKNIVIESDQVSDRLDNILKRTGQDLQQAGQTYEAFYKKKYVVKYIQGQQWDNKFVELARKFEELKSELNICVTAAVARSAGPRYEEFREPVVTAPAPSTRQLPKSTRHEDLPKSAAQTKLKSTGRRLPKATGPKSSAPHAAANAPSSAKDSSEKKPKSQPETAGPAPEVQFESIQIFNRISVPSVPTSVVKIEDSVVSVGQSAKGAYDWYEDHKDAVDSALSALANATSGDIVMKKASELLEAAEKVVNGLDVIKSIHPFVGVAVIVFQKVVSLELTRRKNDDRVAALITQASEMMGTLFRLKDIKEFDIQGPDGQKMRGAVQVVLDKVAADIKSCGNTIDKYYEVHVIAKFFKASSWEDKFLGIAKTFVGRTDEITRALAIHTALAVDTIGSDISSVNEKVNAIFAMLTRKTDEEMAIAAQVTSNGGAEAFLKDRTKLQGLVQLSQNSQGIGGTLVLVASPGKDTDTASISSITDTVAHDATTPLDVLLDEHLQSFQEKLDKQTAELRGAVEEGTQKTAAAVVASEGRIVGEIHIAGTRIETVVLDEGRRMESNIVGRIDAAMNDGAHKVIENQEVQELWAMNKWPTQIRARDCVHALVEYGREKGLKNEKWTTRYLTVTFVPYLVEAFDRNADALVSVYEINGLFETMPLYWTIREHIAYWAAGWHAESCWYRDAILQALEGNTSLPAALVESVRTLCRSLRDAKESQKDAHLKDLVRQRRDHEEARLRVILTEPSFKIDQFAIRLRFGGQRLESYILPLVYVVIRQHKDATDHDTADTAQETLRLLMGEVDNRMGELAGAPSILLQSA